MALLVATLGDLPVEARQGCLELAPPRVGEHLLEDVNVLSHVVQDVHARRRVIEVEAAHRVLDEGLELPQGQPVRQVRVSAKQRTGRRGVDATGFDEVVPLAKDIKVTGGKDRIVGAGSLKAQGDPELEDTFDRRIRRLRQVAGGIREMTTEQPRNVACCGQVIRSCRGRRRALIHRKSLLFGLTQHHISG